jgi:hypothetical protein
MSRSITLFERLWLGALALGVPVSALTYRDAAAQGGVAFVAIVQLTVVGFTLFIVLMTSRRESRFCKWLVTILFLVGLVFYIPQLSGLLTQGIAGVLSCIQFFLQALGLYYLHFGREEPLEGLSDSALRR